MFSLELTPISDPTFDGFDDLDRWKRWKGHILHNMDFTVDTVKSFDLASSVDY